ncbi:MAG: S8 family serine peptidase, partial [Gammaproteobacteria bacterium]
MVVGPDGGDNSFFGSDDEENGFPNFFGTSAAAPHVAGVAALMNQLRPGITPAMINAALQNTAIDMDDPVTPGFDTGFDFGTGFGLVQADAALGEIQTVFDVTTTVDITRSGFRFDRRTRQFVQQVTVRNTSEIDISGPVSLVLDDLSHNATLVNSSGTTPDGDPFVTLGTGSDGLSQGESARILL